MEKVQFKIGGMSCSFCTETIRQALTRMDGVKEVHAHPELKQERQGRFLEESLRQESSAEREAHIAVKAWGVLHKLDPTKISLSNVRALPTLNLNYIEGQKQDLERAISSSPKNAEKAKQIINEALDLLKSKKEKLEASLLNALTLLLINNPTATAEGLYWAHLVFQKQTPDTIYNSTDDEFKPVHKRKYGLARGPTLDEREFREVEWLVGELQKVSEGAAVGLEKGRLPTGLDGLIDNYLRNRSAPSSGDDDKVKAEQQRLEEHLTEELVRFSTKLLSVAHLSVLLDDRPQEARMADESVQEPKRDFRADLTLLQAVGNAILTQVNELTRFSEYQKKGRLEYQAFHRTWEKSIKDLPDNLKNRIERDPRAVLDLVVANLRADLIKKRVQNQSTAEIENLEAAIKIAEEHRKGVVHLRPAAAYLRNSFLFTGLQRDSGATWKNLLSQHGGRQVGWTGESNVDVIQEFDKQYWQNINRVRVAGAGATNYVVTKDDIGNWYVKGFSSDPEKIIQTAKSLALFSAGGAIRADALKRASKALGQEGLSGEAAAEAIKGNLIKDQSAAAKTRLDLQTEKQLEGIKNQVPGLRAKIISRASDEKLTGLLDIALELSSSLRPEDINPKAEDKLKEVFRTLEAFGKYREGITKNLDKNLIKRNVTERQKKLEGEIREEDNKNGDKSLRSLEQGVKRLKEANPSLQDQDVASSSSGKTLEEVRNDAVQNCQQPQLPNTVTQFYYNACKARVKEIEKKLYENDKTLTGLQNIREANTQANLDQLKESVKKTIDNDIESYIEKEDKILQDYRTSLLAIISEPAN